MYDPEYRRYSIDFDKITVIISKLESRGYENVQLFPEITNLDKLSTILSWLNGSVIQYIELIKNYNIQFVDLKN